ncbi:MAG: hypothetical protein ACTSXQ_06805 [Alphaproteobacteria bacterium]
MADDEIIQFIEYDNPLAQYEEVRGNKSDIRFSDGLTRIKISGGTVPELNQSGTALSESLILLFGAENITFETVKTWGADVFVSIKGDQREILKLFKQQAIASNIVVGMNREIETGARKLSDVRVKRVYETAISESNEFLKDLSDAASAAQLNIQFPAALFAADASNEVPLKTEGGTLMENEPPTAEEKEALRIAKEILDKARDDFKIVEERSQQRTEFLHNITVERNPEAAAKREALRLQNIYYITGVEYLVGDTGNFTDWEKNRPTIRKQDSQKDAKYEYDEHGRLLKEQVHDVFPYSQIYHYGNDQFQNSPTAVLDADKAGDRFQYNDAGQIIKKTRNGKETEYQYSSDGRLVGEITPERIKYEYEHDDQGRIQQRLKDGIWDLWYEYDPETQGLSYYRNPENERLKQYKRDENGSVNEVIILNGSNSSYEYEKTPEDLSHLPSQHELALKQAQNLVEVSKQEITADSETLKNIEAKYNVLKKQADRKQRRFDRFNVGSVIIAAGRLLSPEEQEKMNTLFVSYGIKGCQFEEGDVQNKKQTRIIITGSHNHLYLMCFVEDFLFSEEKVKENILQKQNARDEKYKAIEGAFDELKALQMQLWGDDALINETESFMTEKHGHHKETGTMSSILFDHKRALTELFQKSEDARAEIFSFFRSEKDDFLEEKSYMLSHSFAVYRSSNYLIEGILLEERNPDIEVSALQKKGIQALQALEYGLVKEQIEDPMDALLLEVQNQQKRITEQLKEERKENEDNRTTLEDIVHYFFETYDKKAVKSGEVRILPWHEDQRIKDAGGVYILHAPESSKEYQSQHGFYALIHYPKESTDKVHVMLPTRVPWQSPRAAALAEGISVYLRKIEGYTRENIDLELVHPFANYMDFQGIEEEWKKAKDLIEPLLSTTIPPAPKKKKIDPKKEVEIMNVLLRDLVSFENPLSAFQTLYAPAYATKSNPIPILRIEDGETRINLNGEVDGTALATALRRVFPSEMVSFDPSNDYVSLQGDQGAPIILLQTHALAFDTLNAQKTGFETGISTLSNDETAEGFKKAIQDCNWVYADFLKALEKSKTAFDLEQEEKKTDPPIVDDPDPINDGSTGNDELVTDPINDEKSEIILDEKELPVNEADEVDDDKTEISFVAAEDFIDDEEEEVEEKDPPVDEVKKVEDESLPIEKVQEDTWYDEAIAEKPIAEREVDLQKSRESLEILRQELEKLRAALIAIGKTKSAEVDEKRETLKNKNDEIEALKNQVDEKKTALEIAKKEASGTGAEDYNNEKIRLANIELIIDLPFVSPLLEHEEGYIFQEKTNELGEIHRFEHDERGNVTRQIAQDTDPEETITYIYDSNGDLEREETQDGDIYDFSYNDDANVSEVKDKDDGLVSTFTYDEKGRLQTRVWVPNNETITYSYNENNQLIKEVSSDETSTEYFYTEGGILEREVKTDGSEESAEIIYVETINVETGVKTREAQIKGKVISSETYHLRPEKERALDEDTAEINAAKESLKEAEENLFQSENGLEAIVIAAKEEEKTAQESFNEIEEEIQQERKENDLEVDEVYQALKEADEDASEPVDVDALFEKLEALVEEAVLIKFKEYRTENSATLSLDGLKDFLTGDNPSGQAFTDVSTEATINGEKGFWALDIPRIGRWRYAFRMWKSDSDQIFNFVYDTDGDRLLGERERGFSSGSNYSWARGGENNGEVIDDKRGNNILAKEHSLESVVSEAVSTYQAIGQELAKEKKLKDIEALAQEEGAFEWDLLRFYEGGVKSLADIKTFLEEREDLEGEKIYTFDENDGELTVKYSRTGEVFRSFSEEANFILENDADSKQIRNILYFDNQIRIQGLNNEKRELYFSGDRKGKLAVTSRRNKDSDEVETAYFMQRNIENNEQDGMDVERRYYPITQAEHSDVNYNLQKAIPGLEKEIASTIEMFGAVDWYAYREAYIKNIRVGKFLDRGSRKDSSNTVIEIKVKKKKDVVESSLYKELSEAGFKPIAAAGKIILEGTTHIPYLKKIKSTCDILSGQIPDQDTLYANDLALVSVFDRNLIYQEVPIEFEGNGVRSFVTFRRPITVEQAEQIKKGFAFSGLEIEEIVFKREPEDSPYVSKIEFKHPFNPRPIDIIETLRISFYDWGNFDKAIRGTVDKHYLSSKRPEFDASKEPLKELPEALKDLEEQKRAAEEKLKAAQEKRKSAEDKRDNTLSAEEALEQAEKKAALGHVFADLQAHNLTEQVNADAKQLSHAEDELKKIHTERDRRDLEITPQRNLAREEIESLDEEELKALEGTEPTRFDAMLAREEYNLLKDTDLAFLVNEERAKRTAFIAEKERQITVLRESLRNVGVIEFGTYLGEMGRSRRESIAAQYTHLEEPDVASLVTFDEERRQQVYKVEDFLKSLSAEELQRFDGAEGHTPREDLAVQYTHLEERDIAPLVPIEIERRESVSAAKAVLREFEDEALQTYRDDHDLRETFAEDYPHLFSPDILDLVKQEFTRRENIPILAAELRGLSDEEFKVLEANENNERDVVSTNYPSLDLADIETIIDQERNYRDERDTVARSMRNQVETVEFEALGANENGEREAFVKDYEYFRAADLGPLIDAERNYRNDLRSMRDAVIALKREQFDALEANKNGEREALLKPFIHVEAADLEEMIEAALNEFNTARSFIVGFDREDFLELVGEEGRVRREEFQQSFTYVSLLDVENLVTSKQAELVAAAAYIHALNKEEEFDALEGEEGREAREALLDNYTLLQENDIAFLVQDERMFWDQKTQIPVYTEEQVSAYRVWLTWHVDDLEALTKKDKKDKKETYIDLIEIKGKKKKNLEDLATLLREQTAFVSHYDIDVRDGARKKRVIFAESHLTEIKQMLKLNHAVIGSIDEDGDLQESPENDAVQILLDDRLVYQSVREEQNHFTEIAINPDNVTALEKALTSLGYETSGTPREEAGISYVRIVGAHAASLEKTRIYKNMYQQVAVKGKYKKAYNRCESVFPYPEVELAGENTINQTFNDREIEKLLPLKEKYKLRKDGTRVVITVDSPEQAEEVSDLLSDEKGFLDKRYKETDSFKKNEKSFEISVAVNTVEGENVVTVLDRALQEYEAYQEEQQRQQEEAAALEETRRQEALNAENTQNQSQQNTPTPNQNTPLSKDKSEDLVEEWLKKIPEDNLTLLEEDGLSPDQVRVEGGKQLSLSKEELEALVDKERSRRRLEGDTAYTNKEIEELIEALTDADSDQLGIFTPEELRRIMKNPTDAEKVFLTNFLHGK